MCHTSLFITPPPPSHPSSITFSRSARVQNVMGRGQASTSHPRTRSSPRGDPTIWDATLRVGTTAEGRGEGLKGKERG